MLQMPKIPQKTALVSHEKTRPLNQSSGRFVCVSSEGWRSLEVIFLTSPRDCSQTMLHTARVPGRLFCWLLRADIGSRSEAYVTQEVFSEVFTSGLGVAAKQGSRQILLGTFSTDPAKPGLSPVELDSL